MGIPLICFALRAEGTRTIKCVAPGNDTAPVSACMKPGREYRGKAEIPFPGG